MARVEFAHGGDEIDGVPCVATAIGEEMTDEVLTIAEEYDRVAERITGKHEGVISAEDAEEFWNQALSNLESRAYNERIPEHGAFLKAAIREGERIRDEAF